MTGDVEPTLLDQHVDHCRRRGIRPTTLAQRRWSVLRFRGAVGVDPPDATRAQAHDWWGSLTSGPGSRSNELSHVHAYVRWAIRFEHRTLDPFQLLDPPRKQRRYPRPISADRLERALDAAESSPRISAILTLAAYSGLRACEISDLRWREVTDTVIHVLDGKGGKQRMVPLHPKVDAALARLPAGGGHVLCRMDGEPGPMTPSRVSNLANAHLRKLGYADTLHSLRHRFGTVAYQKSLDLRLVQDMLGHASPTTTALYAAWDTSKAQAVVTGL